MKTLQELLEEAYIVTEMICNGDNLTDDDISKLESYQVVLDQQIANHPDYSKEFLVKLEQRILQAINDLNA